MKTFSNIKLSNQPFQVPHDRKPERGDIQRQITFRKARCVIRAEWRQTIANEGRMNMTSNYGVGAIEIMRKCVLCELIKTKTRLFWGKDLLWLRHIKYFSERVEFCCLKSSQNEKQIVLRAVGDFEFSNFVYFEQQFFCFFVLAKYAFSSDMLGNVAA